MRAWFVATLLLVTTSGATPAPTSVPSVPAGPIAVTSCDVVKQNSQLGTNNLFMNGKAFNFFKVGFVNNGNATADRIVFQIDFDKSRYVVGDKGTYGPGNSVTHTYRDHGSDVTASARPAGTTGTVCTVLSAHFTDGTTWP